MADFPTTLGQGIESKEIWIDPMLVSRARGGGFKGRLLQSGKKRGFEVVLKGLTDAEKSTFETFYDTNRALTMNFYWEDALSTPYVVAFANRDAISWSRMAPGYWLGTVMLEES